MLRISKKSKTAITLCVAAALVAACVLWIIWGNVTFGTTHYDIASAEIPDRFDGYKIVQISDLHNAEFGDDNSALIQALQAEQPDIIAITGDIVDSNHTDIAVALSFVRQAVKIAPCYYITGNHEAWLNGQYDGFQTEIMQIGVTVLRNESTVIKRGGDEIQLIGLDDPEFANQADYTADAVLDDSLSDMSLSDSYKILFSHRPNGFEIYKAHNIDLSLTGHVHGGQIRLPFIGGVLAPGFRMFPEYDAGVYRKDGSTMIVSRGLGNSIIPVRINDRPELVTVTLHSSK